MIEEKKDAGLSFAELDLAPEVLQAVRDAGYTHPTPIQQQAIPLALAGAWVYLLTFALYSLPAPLARIAERYEMTGGTIMRIREMHRPELVDVGSHRVVLDEDRDVADIAELAAALLQQGVPA